VTIVTTKAEDMVYGITVSSFSSLSVDPLLILVCIQNSNQLVEMVKKSGTFAVSILAEGQEEISGHFAISGREPVEQYEQFGTIEWHTGSPIVDGAVAHLDCELHEALPGGDHTILVGRVLGAAFDPGKQPLIYFRRSYRKVVPA
jgi:flavin reductase (DIM6/NTAB) family NADH-FMN oxidoreductase RutF